MAEPELEAVAEELRKLAALSRNPGLKSPTPDDLERLADRLAALSSRQQPEGMAAALKVIEGVRDGRLAPAALDEVLQWFELHPLSQPVTGGLTPEHARALLGDPRTEVGKEALAILHQIASQDTEESP